MSMERAEGRGAIETEKMKACFFFCSLFFHTCSILSNKSKKTKTTSTTLY